jgi:hypothetical protein
MSRFHKGINFHVHTIYMVPDLGKSGSEVHPASCKWVPGLFPEGKATGA